MAYGSISLGWRVTTQRIANSAVTYPKLSVAARPKEGTTFIIAANDSNNTDRADYICDGTADEVEINQALNALPTGGGTVLLLEGTFTLAATITIPKNNVTLMGGGNGTIIQTNSNIVMVSATSMSEIIISRIYFYGVGVPNILNNAISFSGVTESIVSECIIDNTGGNGIFLENTSNYNSIINNIIRPGNNLNANQMGININSSNYNEIHGNYIYQGYNCIIIASCNHNKINNNITINGGLNCIFIISADNNIVGFNVANSSPNFGIGINSADNNIIVGNQCNSSDTGGGFGSGILLAGSDNNIINGNRCELNRYGIWISNASCDKNIITGNHCIGNITSAITDNGTNTHPNGASGTNNLALDDLNIIA